MNAMQGLNLLEPFSLSQLYDNAPSVAEMVFSPYKAGSFILSNCLHAVGIVGSSVHEAYCIGNVRTKATTVREGVN